MDYLIEDGEQVIDWLPIFEALSTVQFEKFASRLQFPGQVSPELREISRQFCLAVLTYLATFNSEYQPPQKPADPLYTESESIEPLIQMWTNTFAELKAAGHDELVYNWGKKIQQIKAIRTDVSGLLWFDAFIAWTLDKFNPQIALELPPDLIAKLKTISVEFYTDTRTLNAETTEARQQAKNSNDVLEHYLYASSWFYCAGEELRGLLMLKQIFNLLPSPSLEILDQWGKEAFEDYSLYGYFSLVEFAKTLDKSGLDLSEGTTI